MWPQPPLSSPAAARPSFPAGLSRLYVALWCGLPALLMALLWLSRARDRAARPPSALPPELVGKPIKRAEPDPQRYPATSSPAPPHDPDGVRGRRELVAWHGCDRRHGAALAIALVGIAAGLGRSRLAARARNRVERMVEIGLIACSSLAILTTIGIVLSLLFEALRFFAQVPLIGLPVRPAMEPADGDARRPGRRVRRFGAVPLSPAPS